MKKKLNRILAVVVAIFMSVSMTACGGDTTPETTKAPETTAAPTTESVNVCETNGHTWADATCDVAKTCSVCGETEGEALGHTWVDANYQQPKTCSVCSAIEGEALVAYFTECGLDAKLMEKAGEFDITLPCGADDTKTTVAKLTVEDYKTITSDETHEALDGYEWKILTFKECFSDENANKYGFRLGGYLWADRYEEAIKEPGDDDEKNEDGVIEDLFTTGITESFYWNGIEYTEGIVRIEEYLDEWLQDEAGAYYRDFFITISVRVPVGYDGFVFGLTPVGWTWPDGTYLHEVIADDTLLFCLD